MTQKERYAYAKECYAKLGVDTDAAIAKLKEIPISLHCWQGDDVTGFDHDGPLTGGIQTTGICQHDLFDVCLFHTIFLFPHSALRGLLAGLRASE